MIPTGLGTQRTRDLPQDSVSPLGWKYFGLAKSSWESCYPRQNQSSRQCAKQYVKQYGCESFQWIWNADWGGANTDRKCQPKCHHYYKDTTVPLVDQAYRNPMPLHTRPQMMKNSNQTRLTLLVWVKCLRGRAEMTAKMSSLSQRRRCYTGGSSI